MTLPAVDHVSSYGESGGRQWKSSAQLWESAGSSTFTHVLPAFGPSQLKVKPPAERSQLAQVAVPGPPPHHSQCHASLGTLRLKPKREPFALSNA